MATLRTALCAVLMVTVAMSKPVYLNEGEDSSKLSESSESSSSEETANHAEPFQEPLQPACTETDMSDSMEGTDPMDTAALLPSADSEPSPAALDTSALPDPEDPQTSTDTDALQLMPDDPSHTAPGVDIAPDMPDSDPAVNADTVPVVDPEVSPHPGLTETDTVIDIGGTNQPQVTPTTYQGFPQGATPPFPPHIKPTPPPSSPAPPMQIPIGTAEDLTRAPVCVNFQFLTPEPDPSRGDSI